MPLPTVVIVGRPNVGKSSLLNMLARERISIVDARPGITRDRVSTFVEYDNRYLEMVDTGGIGIVDDDHLEEHVEQQIQFAIDRADLILFLVDVQEGRLPLDEHVAARLRKLKKPILLVANKCDDPRHEAAAGELVKLGFGEAICVSALHGRGRDALLGRACDRLGPPDDDAPGLPIMKLAIVGKRNAGKSTLVNALAGEPRVIVSEIPGTTRDAIDVRFQKDGKEYIAIDTAGVRKKSRMSDIDFYSYTRALTSIRRADVVLLLIDASLPVSEVDLKLAQAIMEEYKPVVIGVNKWDLAHGKATAEDYDEYFQKALRNLKYAPIVLLTAREGRNVDAAVDLALTLHKQARTRVTTAKLNDAMRSIVAEREPMPRYGVKRIKIYYATQAAVAPPSFVFFCNNADLVTVNYRRFMENRLREILPFAEVPMRLMFRASVGRSAEEREEQAALNSPTPAAEPPPTREKPAKKAPREKPADQRPAAPVRTRSAPARGGKPAVKPRPAGRSAPASSKRGGPGGKTARRPSGR